MGKEYINGLMGQNIQEIILMEKNKVLEFLNILLEKDMKEIG